MSRRWWAPTPDSSETPELWPDLVTLAATVLGEAEGESYIGKLAVAWVVMNRVADSRWPDEPGAVCLQKLQFSCWNVGSSRLHSMFNPRKTIKERLWNDCFKAAMGAVFGLDPDPTSGANHYLAPKSLKFMPRWYDASKVVAKIDNHEFLFL